MTLKTGSSGTFPVQKGIIMPSNTLSEALKEKLSALYGDTFYAWQMDASYKSAGKYTDFLCSLYKPSSVVDLGCGRGTWLKAFGDNGVGKLVGYDGPWNSQDKMVDSSIMFRAIDLDNTLELIDEDRYDLAMSLEVAEHLQESSAINFVKTLTRLSDGVMFGAAYVQQGGVSHINEQPHTYWAHIFEQENYEPYDLFRPVFWGSDEIDFWYQQNTFLYVKSGSIFAHRLAARGHQPMKNLLFMNCVHPDLYAQKLRSARITPIVRKMVVNAIPQRLRPLARVGRNCFPS